MSTQAPAPLPAQIPASVTANLIQEPMSSPLAPPNERRSPSESRINDQAIKNNERTRSTTERRISRPPPGPEAVTCARCGMLNRSDVSACQRCGCVLHDTDSMPVKEQQTKADLFFEQANYREAANLYARLADKVTDRRQRSIMRSKEREARKLEQENQLNEINSRSTVMLERGDLRAGLDLLERGLATVRDSGASNSGAESQLLHAITSLRYRLRRRQRMRIATVLIVLGLLAASIIAVYAIVYRSRIAAPPSSQEAQP
jgi:hypothetical protein